MPVLPAAVLEDCAKRPFGAALPALSLSNRPMFEDESNPQANTAAAHPLAAAAAVSAAIGGEEGEESEDYGADVPSYPTVLRHPPFEEHLVKNTLWPESRKLFGHNAEALCVASNAYTSTPYFVSGCSAFRPTDATVCVWRDGVPVASPMLHENRGAILSCCCSPDGSMFGSASFDAFVLWQLKGDDRTSGSCKLIASLKKLFANNPTCCKWSPVFNYIAVIGAKNGAVHILRLDAQEDGSLLLAPYGTVSPANGSDAVATAVAWTTTENSETPLILAVGDSKGEISLWSVSKPSMKAQADTVMIGTLPKELSHNGQVNSLDWLASDKNEKYLASCGDDWVIRITAVDFNKADGDK